MDTSHRPQAASNSKVAIPSSFRSFFNFYSSRPQPNMENHQLQNESAVAAAASPSESKKAKKEEGSTDG
ncbi:hypothetical protein EYC84_005513 [Monilinia fructicola]|uniref:Uncharacterized protein n=1 Tax=Monilinia fructicola TaxID=38448 RepID=A0A5M9JZN1_MONFR|nr:hypothetical protein EYC84_005513 [Monilinia fructicola]